MNTHADDRTTFAIIVDGELVVGLEWIDVSMSRRQEPEWRSEARRISRAGSPAVTDHIDVITASCFATPSSISALRSALERNVRVEIQPAGFGGLLDRSLPFLLASLATDLFPYSGRCRVNMELTSVPG